MYRKSLYKKTIIFKKADSRMRIAKKIRNISALTLILIILPEVLFAATELRDIRTGNYQKFTRVVFEFNQSIQFAAPMVDTDGTISISFQNATSSLQSVLNPKKTKKVKSIQVVQNKSNLSVDVIIS